MDYFDIILPSNSNELKEVHPPRSFTGKLPLKAHYSTLYPPSFKIDQPTIASDNFKYKVCQLCRLRRDTPLTNCFNQVTPSKPTSGITELLKTMSYDIKGKRPQVIINSSLVT